MNTAIGLIETKGLIGLVEATDAMAKAANVQIVKRIGIGGAYVTTIVTGDLNAGENSAEVKALRGGAGMPGRLLADSYRELYPQRQPDEATFGNWRGQIEGRRIDFILHTGEFTPTAAAIVRTHYDGRWPSDHYPVTATLRTEANES